MEYLEEHCKLENEKGGNKFHTAFDFVYLPVDFKLVTLVNIHDYINIVCTLSYIVIML